MATNRRSPGSWVEKRVSRCLRAVPTRSGMATLGTPPAGWYPDPALRHQARFWDGSKWTERVADNGVEGSDPVPGTDSVQTAESTTGGVDPGAAAWSAQLLGNTDLDGAIPQVAPAE